MSTLRQTATNWSFYKKPDTPEAYAARLKAMGYYGLELLPREWFPIAKAAGLKVQNIGGCPISPGLNREENHPQALMSIRSAIALAHASDIPQVLVFSGNRGDHSEQQGVANCAKALRQVAREAEQAGVTLLLEVLCAQNHAGYEADHSDYAFSVVKQVNSPAVKVLYDIYHMHRMGEAVADVIAREVQWIGHLHIAGSPKRDFPGSDQEIDYQRVVQTALAAGYTGCWGQEFLPGPDIYAELNAALQLFNSYAAQAATNQKSKL